MTEETQPQELVYALATSPGFARDGICFAARPSGLYRSDDGGHSWRFAYDSLNLESPLATTTVVLSPDFEADQTVFAGVAGGLLRSTDGGQSWQASVLPSPPPLVSTLVISPQYDQDGTVLAGTMEDGVFRSADRGGRWYPWNFGLLDLNVLAMVISPNFGEDETLFVGADSGIFRSTNGGRAWREINLPVGFTPVLSLAISPGYASDGVLFAGTEAHGLLYSEDRGQSWVRLGEDKIAEVVNGVVLSPEFPAQPDVLVMLSDSLLMSHDRGRTWQNRALPAEAFPASTPPGFTSVAAPQGLGPGAPLLIGMVGGEVVRF
jgi:photosystem II stability/assembly factor-like uncharacterized protein